MQLFCHEAHMLAIQVMTFSPNKSPPWTSQALYTEWLFHFKTFFFSFFTSSINQRSSCICVCACVCLISKTSLWSSGHTRSLESDPSTHPGALPVHLLPNYLTSKTVCILISVWESSTCYGVSGRRRRRWIPCLKGMPAVDSWPLAHGAPLLLRFSHFSTSAPSAHQPYPVKTAAGARVSYIENATPAALRLAPQPGREQTLGVSRTLWTGIRQCSQSSHIHPWQRGSDF